MSSDSDQNDPVLEYAPLTSLDDLRSYGTEPGSSGYAYTLVDGDLIPSCTFVRRTVPLSRRFSNVKIQTNCKRYYFEYCGKTIVCHDMKGGYLDDRFINGSTCHTNYFFRHWLQTDIFCYFSHHFVTIPPVGWINAAHAHGVKCIGTIITESKEGKLLCQKLLESEKSVVDAVEKLCLVAKHFKFDGYLVNIENEVDSSLVPNLILFVRLLTIRLKELNSDNTVIWYDSVTIDGELKWQDELNDLNRDFFEACDGIYLNYCWNDDKLQQSLSNAGDRRFDVYVGVDVFGRGCYGGGGLNTCMAVEKIASYKLSTAIFAPGWSYECHPYEKFAQVDDSLWKACANHFLFRTWTDATTIQGHPSLVDGFGGNNKNSYSYEVLLTTDFNSGCGRGKYLLGKQIADNSWYDLSSQSFQVILNCFRPSDCSPPAALACYDFDDGFFGGGSLKITSHDPGYIANINLFEAEPSCPLWVPLNVPVRGNIPNDSSKRGVVVIVVWKPVDSVPVEKQPIRFALEFMKPTLHNWKVIKLNNVAEQIVFERPEEPIRINFKDFVPVEYSNLPEIQDISFVVEDTPYAESQLNGWNVSCFIVDVNHCVEWNITAFRLGAQTTSNIGLISLGLLKY